MKDTPENNAGGEDARWETRAKPESALPQNARCKNCAYWHNDPDNPKLGECRRNSPVGSSLKAGVPWFWPVTGIFDVCGDHDWRGAE